VALLVRAGLLLLDAVIQSAWLPVLATAQLLLYLDLRIRREAYDLELLTEAVEARARQLTKARAGSQPPPTLLFVLTFLLTSPPCQADPTLRLSQYRAALEQTRVEAAAALGGRPGADWAQTRGQLAASLPPRARVRMPAGPVVDVDNRALLQELDRDRPLG